MATGAEALEFKTELSLRPGGGSSDCGGIVGGGLGEGGEQSATPQCRQDLGRVAGDGADDARSRAVEVALPETDGEGSVDAGGEGAVAAEALKASLAGVAKDFSGAAYGVLAVKRALAEQDAVDVGRLSFGR